MRKLLMIVSAVAMAGSMPALAEKGGKGGGGGHGGGGPKAEKVHHGGGGGGPKAGKVHRGDGHARAEKVRGGDRFKPDKAERRLARAAGPERKQRGPRFDRSEIREQREVRRDFAVERERRDWRDDRHDFAPLRAGLAGVDQRCPPGLAKKRNGCLPPGQAKRAFVLGDRLERERYAAATIPSRYRSLYADTPDSFYRYDDEGYIYRVDQRTSLISGLVPLLGGGFAVGQPLPAGYDVYNVPLQYRDTWADSDQAHYRYGDNAIYQVDPQSNMIENIVALLTGDLNVGEALPAGYDVYNLPLDYRDEYQDGDDRLYRYADGNIYQVDAKTRVIEAIVEMLT